MILINQLFKETMKAENESFCYIINKLEMKSVYTIKNVMDEIILSDKYTITEKPSLELIKEVLMIRKSNL